jgi:curved DNA-binding protein
MQGGGFGGGFEDLGGGFGAEPPETRARVANTLEDSYHGAQRMLSLSDGRTLNVRIPKGVIAGQTIRLAQQGARGGDLMLEVEFTPHPQFRVEGRDITVTVTVAPWEAALGGKVPVPTLGGVVELALPAGTQSGRKLRLKARGLPGTTPGDQFVAIQLATPPAASDADRAFYEEMAQRFSGFAPRN